MPTTGDKSMHPSPTGLPGDAKVARREFLDGKDVPTGVVPDLIVRSWQRAVSAGVRPDQRVLFEDVITLSDVRRSAEESRTLIELAGTDMEVLAGAFRLSSGSCCAQCRRRDCVFAWPPGRGGRWIVALAAWPAP